MMSLLKFGVVAVCVGLIGILVSLFSSSLFQYKDEVRYSFNTEWDDSGNYRKFLLNFFPRDEGVELYDVQTKKVFLKRYLDAGIKQDQLYPGNIVIILSRQLKISGYGDKSTRDILGKAQERTFAMVKPDAIHNLGEVLKEIEDKGFKIVNMKMAHLSPEQASIFYEEHKGRNFFESMVNYITSGPIVALELQRTQAVTEWRKTLGPTDSNVAKEEFPHTIRALFGTDKQANAAHGSDSNLSAERELTFFFGNTTKRISPQVQPTANFHDSALCVIKPHAVMSGHLGSILSAISKQELQITALQMFRITKLQASQYMEIYEGVIPDYTRYLEQLLSGPLVAIEIGNMHDSPKLQEIREFIGPLDPDLAKLVRPTSLRAKFGVDKIQNAVSCTDLFEEGVREVEYFFNYFQPKF